MNSSPQRPFAHCWLNAGLLAGIMVCFMLGGCAKAPYTGRTQFITMSEHDEMRLGVEAQKELMKEEKTETGTPRAARVERVGKHIAAAADKPSFMWEFHTIPSDTLNAFCLPGGKIFVYTALLELTQDNDAELAAIMGHEVAHALARHSAERASQAKIAAITQVAASTAVGIATGSQAAASAAQKGFGAAAQLGLLLPYGRTQESEADAIGIILAAKAGYDPRAALSFWKKMSAANKGKEPPALLSTHPLNAKRMNDLEREMPKALPYYRPS